MSALLEAPARPFPGIDSVPPRYAGRDRAVLHLTALGSTWDQIAKRLGVSRHTVRLSVGRIRAAYGATNAAHAVARALACGDLRASPTAAPKSTVRQRDAIGLVAEGLSDAQIARRMGIAGESAELGQWKVLPRFGAVNRPNLVLEAYRCGVLVPDADGRSLMLAGGAS